MSAVYGRMFEYVCMTVGCVCVCVCVSLCTCAGAWCVNASGCMSEYMGARCECREMYESVDAQVHECERV